MEPIRVIEPDGPEPLPICRVKRQWLIDRYRLDSARAIRLFAQDVVLCQIDQAADLRAIEHVRRCPDCQAWLSTIIGEDVMVRQRRMAQYCCGGMYMSVEEWKRSDKPRFKFELYRGEDPIWTIAGKRCVASYCPWCGTKLPDRPFAAGSGA